MPLPRRAVAGNCFDPVEVNVFDITTKAIVFTGTFLDAANFLGVQHSYIGCALKRKYNIKRRYAIRYKKDNNEVKD